MLLFAGFALVLAGFVLACVVQFCAWVSSLVPAKKVFPQFASRDGANKRSAFPGRRG